MHKNSTYVRGYLNDANMRSGVFMSAIIVILEVWLIIRQTGKYVIPAVTAVENPTPLFQAIFQNLWTYFLLLSLGVAMMAYSFQYISRKKSKWMFVTTIVFAGMSLVLACFFPFEFVYKSIKFTSTINTYRAIFKLIFYGTIIAFNIAVILVAIKRYRGEGQLQNASVAVIVLFALVCLAFGIMISYGDFTSSKIFYYDDGNPVILDDAVGSYAYEHKQIICFLMMAIYVGCLLIWKPYVSIGILGAIFLGFYIVLDQLTYVGGRRLPEGDQINYITFFISLTMVCISIYNQRISEAKKDEELEELATKDTLTGLLSFEYFNSLVRQKIDSENIKEDEYAYLFMNIKNFKVYNDQKGFEEGNVFLKRFGEFLSEAFPEGLITRQSDDHFVLFVKNEELHKRLVAVNKKTEKQEPDIRPSIKVGGYPFRDSVEDTHLSIEKARYALDVLEDRAGNEIFILYDKELHENYRMAQYVVNHIDTAIKEGWLKAYYQPVVYANTRELCGAEALARWIDPKYGFLSPGKFIPALENSQLIYRLDIAMLTLVCKQMRENLDKGEPVIPVSINFSRIDFKVMDIVKVIDGVVKQFNIPRNLLHVEITESALAGDKELLLGSINKLHDLGYAVWLDDFGSGYSSFNILKEFSFDVLKLDMEFLNGFEKNEKAKLLVQSVIMMANQVGMKT
ncbi:MAG: EAL domain-containing protein, partial [Bacilli bacterium]|nr:EAL domain-containing protein [Bacilli bacterium]